MGLVPLTSRWPIVVLSYSAYKALALKVTPDSPCASLCLDSAGASSTNASDITCLDADYGTTAVGQKFESCVSCLQNSTASGSGQNDQEWYFYNLRYALDTCLFGFGNATDAVDTPCSLQPCSPLQEALGDGDFNPANETEFSYCSAGDNAILGSGLSSCVSCLRSSGTELYLANFLIALKAGCLQKPPAGSIIGIEGTVFSTTVVNITYLGYTLAKKHTGLTESAVIGITVGLVILFIIASAVFFICFRKRKARNRMKKLVSPLDPRFGATDITAPNPGSYGNPFANPPVAVTTPVDATSTLSEREVKSLKERGVIPKEYISRVELKDPDGWYDAHADRNRGSIGSSAVMPIHPAYVPSPQGSVSPTSSTTSNTHVSPYPSSRSSPNIPTSRFSSMNIPPSRTSPKNFQQDQRSRTSPQAFQPDRASQASPEKTPPPILRRVVPYEVKEESSEEEEWKNTQVHSQSFKLQQPPRGYSSKRVRSRSRADNKPHQDGHADSRPRTEGGADSQTRDNHFRFEIKADSRIQGDSQTHSGSQTREVRQRSDSTMEAVKRGRRTTSRSGIGNVNASAVERIEIPVEISGTLIRNQGLRLGFELAQAERKQAEERAALQKKDNLRPESEVEQWPGTY